MNHNISKPEIQQAVAGVMHPTINCSLLELGIIKRVEIENGKIIITMAFPFANIPIKDYLINSVREATEEFETTVEIKSVVMTKDELQKFLALEKTKWRSHD